MFTSGNAKSGFIDALMLGYLHCVVGVGISVLVGFLPEVFLSRYYVDTRLEAFAPAIAITGLVLGLVLVPDLGTAKEQVWLGFLGCSG